MTYKVRVTAKDIKYGVPGPLSCPIARAINRIRALQGYTVGTECLYRRPGEWVNLPLRAKQFIARFDSKDNYHSPLKPFVFKIEVPNPKR